MSVYEDIMAYEKFAASNVKVVYFKNLDWEEIQAHVARYAKCRNALDLYVKKKRHDVARYKEQVKRKRLLKIEAKLLRLSLLETSPLTRKRGRPKKNPII